jgi:hypothetical protein
MGIIFVLDLDGTIIGDCVYQAEIYKIGLILSKLGIKVKINEILNSFYMEKSRLVRPYFQYFMRKMSEMYPSISIYIYTASERRWAEKEIGIIEKALDIKFNRPIFTRDDCIETYSKEDNRIDYKKSIELIRKKMRVKDRNGEIMIIDDKDVYIDNNDRLIKCELYNYKYFCNYWEYIPIGRVDNKVFMKYLRSLIDNKRLNPNYNPMTMKQSMNYYKWLYEKTMEINRKNNKRYKDDKFWLKLTNILVENKINIFNSNTIKFIEKSLIMN